MELNSVLKNPKTRRTLFSFYKSDKLLDKFKLFSNYYYSNFFKVKSAKFHDDIIRNLINVYFGKNKYFVNIVFRGGAKTTLTKLFLVFAILNDLEHRRKFFKILTYDTTNSKQFVTDLYNLLVNTKVLNDYPETFTKQGKIKREESMKAFTTSFGVRVIADTVGVDQRGQIQEDARPDFIIFDDFENRNTLKSAVITKKIWDNMEEARLGLSNDGVCVYLCNYISEAGNVHKLVKKDYEGKVTMIVPIIENDKPTWQEMFNLNDIEKMRKEDEDFEGERLCKPSISAEILFNRKIIDNMKPKEPVKISGKFKIFYEYEAGHSYASGHDVAGGIGLDSSTSVFIDFSTYPARVVATFADNEIKPEAFGDEIYRQQSIYGNCLSAIENNFGTECILKARMLGANLYKRKKKDTMIDRETNEYGWNTNSLTKSKMINMLVDAVNKGLLDLTDEELIEEARTYTRNDMLERNIDPRLTTRHFDLLMACAIAWQMKDEAFNTIPKKLKKYKIYG